jgi:hypothetical protein
MKKYISLLTLLLPFLILAQTFDSTAWKYAKTINEDDIKKHLRILASDEFEGRETGKKGQKMAMKYLIDKFSSFGIKDFENREYVQEFSLIEQENKGVTITIDEETFKLTKDFLISPSIYSNQKIEAEVVFVDYGIADSAYNSFDGVDVKGKYVFFWNKNPEKVELIKEWDSKKRIEYAKKNGAKGALYYDEKVGSLIEKYEHYFKKPRMRLAADPSSDFISIRMDKRMTETLLNQGKLKLKKVEKKGVDADDRFETKIQIDINKPTEDLTGENVLAYIPGTDKKEELIILTAHYDHLGIKDSLVYNGADDDGSGTSALIEIAEAFMKAVEDGNRPKRSILIMPVSGEEKGLLGSKYYTDNPVFPLKNTVANLNVDMIGRYDDAHENDSNYVYLIGSDKLSQDLHNTSEKVNETYMNFNLDYTFNAEDDPNRFYYRSDHYNFAKNKVPVIFYFSGVHEDYHKATDTFDKVDYAKTAKIGRLIFLTAWHLANAEERIQLDDE